METLAKLFESAARLTSTPVAGYLFPGGTALKYTCEEPVQGTSREFYKAVGSVDFPLFTAALESYSPSRNLKLAVREGDKKEEQVFELWDRNRMFQVKNLKKHHSIVLKHAAFGRVAWSSDENFIAYIAEACPAKSGSFWSEEETKGNQNLYKENFGENLREITNPRLFVYNLSENSTKEVSVPENIHPAQCTFVPNTHKVVYIGYEKTPFIRGLSAMLNRSSSLYLTDIQSTETKCLGKPQGTMGVQYPKFNQSGSLGAFYAIPEGTKSHATCLTLHLLDYESLEFRLLVDLVHEDNDHFNGLYGFHDELSSYGWVSNDTLVFKTHHRVNEPIWSVKTDGTLQKVPIPLESPFSASLLDVQSNKALVAASNFKTFPKVFTSTFNEGTFETQLTYESQTFNPSPEDSKIINTLENAQVRVLQHKNSSCQSLLYLTDPQSPLIIHMHGGPHTNAYVDYSFATSFRLACGYNVLSANYRGSTGFGKNELESLLGNIGFMDVEDCLEALSLAKEHLNTQKIVSLGGSHGGFLSGHLAGRGVCSASVIVNGVADVSSMSYVSDITDWTFAEVLNKDSEYPMSSQDLQKMYEASPLNYMHKVSNPCLIAAGGSDLRVPSQASLQFYRNLKERGVDVKMLWYPEDGHPLAKKPTTYDLLTNIAVWLQEKLT